MDERAELLRKLADAEQALATLPLAHQVRHPHSVRARRIALEAKVKWLQQELSTARCGRTVEEVPNPGDDIPCLDGSNDADPAPVHSNSQGSPQV